MSQGTINPDGVTATFPVPDMDGLICEVQHSARSGKPVSVEHGLCGYGVVIMPNGQPKVLLQVKHADGTSLSVPLQIADAATLLECLTGAIATALTLSRTAHSATKQ